jgi:hypothetical protein
MNQQIVERLFSEDHFIYLLGGTIAIVAILGSTVKGIVSSMARERSRREIAAYIAEGSMTPEQGEKLMAASSPRKSC